MFEMDSPLQYQTRCVSIFHDMTGFAIGGIEGRVALEYFDEFQFKGKTCKSVCFRFFIHQSFLFDE